MNNYSNKKKKNKHDILNITEGDRMPDTSY